MEARSDAQIIAASRVEPLVFATVFDRHHDSVHRNLVSEIVSTIRQR